VSQELGSLGIRVNDVMPRYILADRLRAIIRSRARRKARQKIRY